MFACHRMVKISSRLRDADSLKTYRCGLPRGGQGPPYPILRKLFTPCLPPLGSVLFGGVHSDSPRHVDGRLYNTQCVHIPPGASGSSINSVKLCVPDGGSAHRNGGEIFKLSHVYRLGIVPPLTNASLQIANLIRMRSVVNVLSAGPAPQTDPRGPPSTSLSWHGQTTAPRARPWSPCRHRVRRLRCSLVVLRQLQIPCPTRRTKKLDGCGCFRKNGEKPCLFFSILRGAAAETSCVCRTPHGRQGGNLEAILRRVCKAHDIVPRGSTIVLCVWEGTMVAMSQK